MVKVIGLKFKPNGKIYYFDPVDIEFSVGDSAIVETVHGVECGKVAEKNHEVSENQVVEPLKKVIRKATKEDLQKLTALKEKEAEAYKICLEKIRAHNLDMNLVDVECSFDEGNMLFYFTADGRVDFRDLVKDLAASFKTHIELRQIGVRDEAKMVGGIGICGRGLCCCGYLDSFVPVSIKMAKEQGLSLNPAKISGVCGRLMCCLKHEQETYEELNKDIPKIGSVVIIPEGRGVVTDVSVLKQKVTVKFETPNHTSEIKTYDASEVKAIKGSKPRKEQEEEIPSELKDIE